MASPRVPMLLCNASFYGTLAAARALGALGVPITMADPSRAAPALWSRHVTRRLTCPAYEDIAALSAWLLRLGDEAGRHVVYATSDEVSFALALHREELEARFALYQPDLEATMRVLDKGQLDAHARAVGLDVPETWMPESQADVERVAREVSGPLLVKPRTQVMFGFHVKGLIAEPGPEGLLSAYARFTESFPYGRELVERYPAAARPMIQRYHPEAADGIYSLAGFRDRSGAHFAVLGARKVLQRPRRLGIGLCFEAAPVDPALAAGAARLCERVGHFGVFEMEFIQVGGRSLLIDMNPRFYSQMGLDIARGLRLAELAYAAALGDDAEVARLVAACPAGDGAGERAFCDRFGLGVQVGVQRLFGSIRRDDARRWKDWLDAHDGALVDAVADADDPRPYAVAIAHQLYGAMRHPRAFLRVIALDQ